MDDNTDFTEITSEPVEAEAPAKRKKPAPAPKADDRVSSKSEAARARVLAKLAAKGK